jgi:hypothetical protein
VALRGCKCPYLHFLVFHSTPRSLLGTGCRAASKIEYESAKGDFCFKPVSARMQRLAIGGGVTIGIAAYSGWDDTVAGGAG